MNKDLATRLVNTVESLYVENLILRTMLNRSFPDWKQAFKQIVANPDQQVLAEILSRFDPLRAAIEEDQNLERALQEFLRVVPTNKDVN